MVVNSRSHDNTHHDDDVSRYDRYVPYKPGHKRHIKVRKRRLNLCYVLYLHKVPMSFSVVVKGCVNFHEMTSVHKKRVFER